MCQGFWFVPAPGGFWRGVTTGSWSWISAVLPRTSLQGKARLGSAKESRFRGDLGRKVNFGWVFFFPIQQLHPQWIDESTGRTREGPHVD